MGSNPLYAGPAFFYLVLLSYIWSMIPAEHLIIREIKTWRSYGIDGKGPTKDTPIKDIGDEHLLNIIKHLRERYTEMDIRFLPTVWDTMHDEVAWRMQECWHSIGVSPDVPNRVS